MRVPPKVLMAYSAVPVTLAGYSATQDHNIQEGNKPKKSVVRGRTSAFASVLKIKFKICKSRLCDIFFSKFSEYPCHFANL